MSQDGLIIFNTNRTGNYEIFSVNPDGTNLKNLTNNSAADGAPMVNSAGTRVTFASNRAGNLDIFTMNVDGSGVKNITNHPGYDYDPAPSEDGNFVAWVSGRSGPGNEIWVANIDGTNPHAITHGTGDYNPNWSSDGKRIVFASSRDNNGGEEIYVMDADGTNVHRLTFTAGRDFYPVFSPDGEEIYFTSERDGNQEIYEMDDDGTNQHNLTNNPASDSLPYYSPDGTRISFVSSRNGFADIYTMDPEDPGASVFQVTNDSAIDAYPGWSKDPAYSPLPVLTLSASTPTLVEASGKTTVTATLSKLSIQPVTVTLAFAGTATKSVDYTSSANAIVIPAGSLTGSVILTAVQDAVYEGSESILVSVASATNATSSGSGVAASILDDDPVPNTKPTISTISNRTINEDGTTGVIPFIVGDAETPAANLTVAKTSTNPTLVPSANIVLGGSGANRTVQVTPAPNAYGTAVIYLQVSDGTSVTNTSFTLTVLPVNDAPVLQSIGGKTVDAGSQLQFTVSGSDVETAGASLTFSAANLPSGATFANRVFTWTPATNQIGTFIVKFLVSDGQLATAETISIVVQIPAWALAAQSQSGGSPSFGSTPGGKGPISGLSLPVTPVTLPSTGSGTTSGKGSVGAVVPLVVKSQGSSNSSPLVNSKVIDQVWTGFGT